MIKQKMLREFFIEVLKVDQKTADEGACLMEHAVSSTIVERMIQYTRYISLVDGGSSQDEGTSFNEFLQR